MERERGDGGGKEEERGTLGINLRLSRSRDLLRMRHLTARPVAKCFFICRPFFLSLEIKVGVDAPSLFVVVAGVVVVVVVFVAVVVEGSDKASDDGDWMTGGDLRCKYGNGI